MADILNSLIKKKEGRLLSLNIPEINENLNLFRSLDEEYILYAENTSGIYNHIVFSPKHIKNKNWRGLWYRATGIDVIIYVTWLIHGIDSGSKIDLIAEYKEAHPNERYIPYSIIMASATLSHMNKMSS